MIVRCWMKKRVAVAPEFPSKVEISDEEKGKDVRSCISTGKVVGQRSGYPLAGGDEGNSCPAFIETCEEGLNDGKKLCVADLLRFVGDVFVENG